MQARYPVLGALGAALCGAVASVKASEPGSPPRSGPAVPVVVELFTSEGCSSCPAADDVLARFERTQPAPGARVVPLAFHVDYWDELGWADRFASPSFTSRQQTYATGGRLYTPQAVVDGKTQFVGSDASALRGAVERAALRPHAGIAMIVRTKGDSLESDVHVGQLPSTNGSSSAVVFVALTQMRATVRVLRGENAGKTLQHTAIVRELREAGSIAARGGDVHATFRVPPAIPLTELRVVAFVQRTADDEIVGAAQGDGVPLSQENGGQSH